MAPLSFTLPTVGNPNSTEDPLVRAALSATQAWANGANVGATQLAVDAKQLFPQLVTPAARKLAFGSAAPGAWGSVAQRDDTIAHGLGANPAFAIGIWSPGIATVSSGGTVLPVIVSLFSKDATNIVLRSRTADGAVTNNASTLFWLAVG